MIYNDILGTIGNTPIVRINRIAPAGRTIYVKIEFFNPAGSVKDRLAIAMIDDAEQRGVLKPGQTVIEPTSGNTGIALAMVCAARGYPFVAVMADSFSVERRKLMKTLGAKVVLMPAAEAAPAWSRRPTRCQQERVVPARSSRTPPTPAYHRNTTGPESCETSSGAASTGSSRCTAPAGR